MNRIDLPAEARKLVYTVYSLTGLVLAVLQASFAAADNGEPGWLKPALAGFAAVGTYVGGLATAHIPTQLEATVTVDEAPDEEGAVQIDLGLIIGIIVGILVAVLVLSLIGHPVTA